MVFAQNEIKICGKVVDASNNSALVGATVTMQGLSTYTAVSDANGQYSLALPKGKYTIICSYIGYHTYEKKTTINGSTELNFNLDADAIALDDVVVSSISANSRLSETQIGVEKINLSEISKTPMFLGESDIIKSIQLLPGIKSEGDGSSGYQVRGGTSAQNLVTLDDATVYNAGHILGIFSTFNDNALSSASLYKGLLPAQYGGGTSSVLNMTSKSGDLEQFHFDGSIGLLSAKVGVEGPIIKNKLSYYITARRSFIDMFLKRSEQFKDNTMNFYDLNAKIHYRIDDNNTLSLSFFRGRDNMGMSDMMDMSWGNTTATAHWFHRFKDNVSYTTSFSWTDYDSNIGIDAVNTHHSMTGFIKHLNWRNQISWYLSEQHDLNVGFQSSLVSLKSAEWQINNLHQKEQRQALDNSIWINDNWNINDRLTVAAGIRFNCFSALGGSPYYSVNDEGIITDTYEYGKGDIVKTYFNIEPRLSMNLRLNDNQSIKLGYSRNTQHIHAIRNGGMSMPFDRYTMSSNLIKPQIADQFSIGYIGSTNDRAYEISVEGYYKDIQNVYDYRDGKTFNSEIEIERLLQGGKGRSYGAEISFRKNAGKFTGWISYTLSWTQNKIQGINNNRWYTSSNDRRHDISVVAMYQLSKSWDCSATWVYNTGQALTAPSAKYDIAGETYYYYAERNGYRAPAYHRLDISFTNTKKWGKFTRQWVFGLYNAYNHYNPYIITFENDASKPSGTKTVQYSLYGIIPSVSFNLSF